MRGAPTLHNSGKNSGRNAVCETVFSSLTHSLFRHLTVSSTPWSRRVFWNTSECWRNGALATVSALSRIGTSDEPAFCPSCFA